MIRNECRRRLDTAELAEDFISKTLVLNTESHLQEAVQGAPEMSFFSHLTVEEKQRTARDVLCFMYCVNPAHVLAHLPNARKELDNWMASIG